MPQPKQLVFVTANPNKIAEVSRQLGNNYNFKGLTDIGCTEEIPETTDTIPGNARQKARFVYDRYGVDCFSEDTGLEIEALDGAPGVHTAYYAGPQRDPRGNMERVLQELQGEPNRKAQFRTVICLIIDNKEYLFEGICEGNIAGRIRGEEGFGYDPIFIPNGSDQTFGQMGFTAKKTYSHRAKAVQKLVNFLQT